MGQQSAFDISSYLDERKRIVDERLAHLLPSIERPPALIHEAMAYSIFAGGKRIRPILALAAAEALGCGVEPVLPFACALEMIHTYSLIHDDLPAMDNDDFRRGRATCHRKFGEAVAILAGNGLMNLAFQILADPDHDDEPGCARRLQVISSLSRALGTEHGVIAGQVADLLTQGQAFTSSELEFIHSAKTGALIKVSVTGAAVLCGADESKQMALDRFGARIGLAFQVVDDILDIVASSKELGKTSGKDRAGHKATYPALFGLEQSREVAGRLVREAIDAVSPFGESAGPLIGIAHFISDRRF